ncbi:MAG: hypothetical protein ACK4VI_03070 [Alphaproteobacteria bacterium]
MDEFDCGSPEEVYSFLDMEYGQTPIFEGLNQNGQLTQIHVGTEAGAWSIVLTDPTVERARQTCIINQGDYWTFGDWRSYPDQNTQGAQSALAFYNITGSIEARYLPSLLESFDEAAAWHGVGEGGHNFVLALNNVGNYAIYADRGAVSQHPHSGMLVGLAEVGEALELNANQGSGVRSMMP